MRNYITSKNLFQNITSFSLYINNGIRKLSKSPIIFSVFIIIISVLLRIPRGKLLYGSDVFEICWMAQAILDGAFFSNKTWLIHPLSYLGLYPYSHYPLLLPLFLSFFLFLGIPLTASIIILDFLLIIGAMIGIYKLAKEIYNNEIFINLLLIFYGLCNNDLLKFTYMTLHPRGVLLSFSPWLLYYLLKILKENKIRDYISAFLLLIIIIFLHKIGLAFVLFFFIVLFQKLITSPKFTIFFEKNILKYIRRHFSFVSKIKLDKILISFILLLLLLYGYNFFPLVAGSASSPFFENTTNLNIIINLIISYLTRIGLFGICFPLGVYVIIFNKAEISQDKRIFILSCLFPLFFIWKIQIYNLIVFLPIFGVLSILGIQYLIKILKTKTILKIDAEIALVVFYVLLSLIFHILYSIFVINLFIIYIVFFGIITIMLLVYLFTSYKIRLPSINKNVVLGLMLIIGSILVNFSVFEGYDRYPNLTTFPYSNDFSQSYITIDEIAVADYLNSQNCTGIVFTSTTRLGRNIGGIGFLNTIPGDHHAQHLYYNSVTREELYGKVFFNFSYFVRTINLDTHQRFYEFLFLDKINNLNITNNADYNKLLSLNVQYVVAFKNLENNTAYPYIITPYGSTYSYFLKTINCLIPVFYTQFLLVWKIY